MSNLGYTLREHEARALREWAKTRSSSLDQLLGEVTPRVLVAVGTPAVLVVKRGKDTRSSWTRLNREKLGLPPKVYFRVGPRCRGCGERILDGERAIAFAFTPTRRTDYWRIAYLHAESCDEIEGPEPDGVRVAGGGLLVSTTR